MYWWNTELSSWGSDVGYDYFIWICQELDGNPQLHVRHLLEWRQVNEQEADCVELLLWFLD